MACGHVKALRLSAIYGANGAGKSNLFFALNLLKSMVSEESLRNISIYDSLSFKFDDEFTNKPSGLAIEFYYNQKVFYYHVEFIRESVLLEELYLSERTKDIELFKREGSAISMNGDNFAKGFKTQFVEVLDRLVRPDMLLLSFMGKYYASEMPLVSEAYSWFIEKLEIILPDSSIHVVPHLFDSNNRYSELVNSMMPEL